MRSLLALLFLAGLTWPAHAAVVHDESGDGEHSLGEKDCRENVHDKPQHRQDIGINAECGEQIDDGVQNPPATGAEHSADWRNPHEYGSILLILIVKGHEPQDFEGSAAGGYHDDHFVTFPLVEKTLADRRCR